MKKLCIFASGNGSNAENIIRHFRNSTVAQVALVVTNNPKAGVIQRCKDLGVDVTLCNSEELASPQGLTRKLLQSGIDLIILAGFLKLIPKPLLDAFPDRIINIHPALLPKYGGAGMYGMKVHEAIITASEKQSGITIHRVNERYDEGAILLQKTCNVNSEDTPGSLAEKIHALEHLHYPVLIESLIKKL